MPDIRKPSTSTTHNGLLRFVPGQFIADAHSKLPPPSVSENHKPERKVEIEIPDLGHIIITFQLRKYRHYRSSYWCWSAAWADAVDKEKSPESRA
ncbi:MAG: hypothetical protein Q7U63_17925 [Polaromonas sp.]|uniref:hypothetical protein n=1 Tax=Polaromonas sp. TaxID=1869339 RepID=UPI00272727F1|nr:hypothetical protein [Polaromonas sp.]MDO9115658.1 hypothetical protein [Polaromonas sp.]MDP1887119.1 hypothetical protein [Polaromonas sp.]